MRHFKLLLILLLMLSATLSGCGDWQVPDWLKFGKRQPQVARRPQVEEVKGTVLVSVNGRIITLEDFNSRIEAYNKEIQASRDIPESVKSNYLISSAEDKKALLDQMVERELIIAEAIARRLDQEEEVARAIKALKEELLYGKLVGSEREKIVVSSKEVENHYNMYKDAFAIPEERRASMIVVPTEQQAKEILIQLLQGSNFAALARERSSDESAKQGGDIGFIVRSLPFPQPQKKTMFAKFEEIAFGLDLNEPSTVFKGPNGFYLIKVTEIKKERQMLLSEVYSDIEQGLMLKKYEDSYKALIGNLRKSSNIIVHDNLLLEE